MTVAIMQPYLFPYLGYYQLACAVDTFVVFDDVNYINKGWINRNQILYNDQAFRFTIPLSGASQNKLINEIRIDDFEAWKKKFLRQLEISYGKAPFFVFTYSLLTEMLKKEYTMIKELTTDSIKIICEAMELKTEFIPSSELDYQPQSHLSGQSKILKICELLKAKTYINPRNGSELYNNQFFTEKELTLNFIWMDDIRYKQYDIDNFVPNLSIIDVLMFNGIEQTRKLLQKYKLKSN